MTETHLNPTPTGVENQLSPKGKKTKKDSFTRLHSFLLIFLTFLVSVGGWYIVGKYFFWNDIDMKRLNGQLEFLEQKVQSEPDNPATRVELGYTYSLKGKNDQALKEFNQALILDPKNFDALYNSGLVMLKEKRYNEALENFQKAVELSPKDYKGHLQKGIAYRNLGMYTEASEALSQANKLLPGSADIIYEVGQVAEAQGQIDTARNIYKEALSYDPLFKDAVTALERLEKK